MIDRIDLSMAPGYDVLSDIMAEARGLFMYEMFTDELIYKIEDYFNRRVEEEISERNFRTSFVAPNNRVAVYECISVRRDPYNPTSIVINPIWRYDDEPEA